MINLSSRLQINPLLEHKKFSPTATKIKLQDWINYNELGFDSLSLGEVVAFLECLQKEVDSEDIWGTSDSILLTKARKQRVIAKWNNTLSAAHIKSFIQAQKEVAKYACPLKSRK